jgi:addiction module HigA family antidote
MLLEEFLKPMGISQSAFAIQLGVSFPRMNEIVRGKRGVTADTALRLAQVLGTSADFWLGLQVDWDLWHAMRSPAAKAIGRLAPIARNDFRAEVMRGLDAITAEGGLEASTPRRKRSRP